MTGTRDVDARKRKQQIRHIACAIGIGIVSALGLLAVSALWCPALTSEGGCPDSDLRWCGAICCAAVKNPPWTLLTSIAAAPSLVLTWYWRTRQKERDIDHKQAEIDIAKREERSKRFVDAIGLLSRPELASRMGAIYSLDSLAQESELDVVRIADTLCAFIRSNPLNQLDGAHERRQGRIVAQAALNAITGLDVGERFLDLRKADLRELDLGAGFRSKVDLRGAVLGGLAKRSGEFIEESRPTLDRILLKRAHLDRANLDGCHLNGAHLEGASLHGASLRSAMLSIARLEGADMNRAVMCTARLYCAHVEGASLVEADLRGANLVGLVFDSTTNFTRAKYNGRTTFPDDFNPEDHEMVRDSSRSNSAQVSDGNESDQDDAEQNPTE